MKAATGSSEKELKAALPQPHLLFCQEEHFFLFQKQDLLCRAAPQAVHTTWQRATEIRNILP